MYLKTLSVTGENIIAFLLQHLGKEYSIREIAQAIGQDYKIVHTTMQHLKKDGLVEINRVSNSNRCSLNQTKDNAIVFGFVSERYAKKKLSRKIYAVFTDIISGVHNPLYVMLLFGSYAKGTSRSSSDIDLLFIIGEKTQENAIIAGVTKAATLNNVSINPIILTWDEFTEGLKERSVTQEAYKNHFVIRGGEAFYMLMAHD